MHHKSLLYICTGFPNITTPIKIRTISRSFQDFSCPFPDQNMPWSLTNLKGFSSQLKQFQQNIARKLQFPDFSKLQEFCRSWSGPKTFHHFSGLGIALASLNTDYTILTAIFLISMLQKFSARILAASSCPQCAAAWNGVHPSKSLTSMSAPAWIKRLKRHKDNTT